MEAHLLANSHAAIKIYKCYKQHNYQLCAFKMFLNRWAGFGSFTVPQAMNFQHPFVNVLRHLAGFVCAFCSFTSVPFLLSKFLCSHFISSCLILTIFSTVTRLFLAIKVFLTFSDITHQGHLYILVQSCFSVF